MKDIKSEACVYNKRTPISSLDVSGSLESCVSSSSVEGIIASRDDQLSAGAGESLRCLATPSSMAENNISEELHSTTSSKATHQIMQIIKVVLLVAAAVLAVFAGVQAEPIRDITGNVGGNMQIFKVALLVAAAVFAILAGAQAEPIRDIGGTVGGDVTDNSKGSKDC
ncbi:hypothetical protein HA402_005668 [Bradysia odoriphaga]|nr:hypothetical protein HA402_005668 [Bradysia odoriphaga]